MSATFSKQTIRHYTFCIQMLQRIGGLQDDAAFLTACVQQPATLLSILDTSHYTLSSKISMISALLWYIRNKQSVADEFQLYPYIKHRDYLQTLLSLEVHERKGGLTKKEESNYMEWNEICEVYSRMVKGARETKRVMEIGELQDLVIIALYVLQPPVRADYGNMRVFLERGDVPADFRDNYFVLYPEPKFVLWRYKNAGRGGVAAEADEHTVEGELLDILEDWLSKNGTPWLLISRIGGGAATDRARWGPMSENALSSRVRSIFRKWTGRTASINTMRHAYVSYVREQGAGTEEKRDVARKMMHHPLTSETYVRVHK